jgi:glucarate dehydratase
MELNLSGAHTPYFTRNTLLLEDTQNFGVGEVPGGQKITSTLQERAHSYSVTAMSALSG